MQPPPSPHLPEKQEENESISDAHSYRVVSSSVPPCGTNNTAIYEVTTTERSGGGFIVDPLPGERAKSLEGTNDKSSRPARSVRVVVPMTRLCDRESQR